jgi:hypothetical protein
MAITSVGGATSFASIQDVAVTAQTYALRSPSSLPTGQVTWMTIGMSTRCATTARSGKSIFTVQNGTGSVEDASGDAYPMDSRLAQTISPYHLAGVALLNLLKASDESLAVVQDSGANTNVVHVRFQKHMSDPSLTPVTQQDWYIDMTTGLPARVDYYLQDITNPSLDRTATVLFSSWQKTPSILMPQTLRTLNNGTAVNNLTLGTPQFNQVLSASIFQLP